MSNIFNRLPFEINCVVFSLLDQHSCLESIKVCHTWFEQVPRHSTTLWKQVDFYYIWTKSNPCLLKCLGSHVREIIVSYHSLDILMTQLKLHCHCYNISSIVVHPGNDNDCVVEEDFITGLKKAREKLTRLTLCELSHNVSLLTIANTCPNLIYLSISLDKYYHKRQKWRQQQQQQQQQSSNTTTHTTPISLPSNSKTPNIIQQQQSPLLLNLKHLQLDTHFDFNSTIIPLLYHCPNIRWIEFSPFMDLEIHMLSTPANYNDFNFCRVLELCPCIEFLECNLMNYPESNNIHIDDFDSDNDENRMASYSSIMNGGRSSTLHDDTVMSRKDSHISTSSSSDNTSSKRRNDIADKDKNEKGEKMILQLREFKFANDQEDRSNRVIELLEKASNTLESLSLKQPIAGYERGLGWTNLQHIKLKRLENLIIGGSIIKKDILVSFLHNHIHTLFHLGLTAPFVSDPSIIQAVSQMERLKRFMVDIEGINLFPRIFPRSRRRRRRIRLHQWYNEGQQQQQQQNQYNYNSIYNNHDYYPLQTIGSRTRHSSYSTPSTTAITSTARRQLHRTRSFIQPKTPSLSKNIYLLANIATLQEIDITGVRLSDESLYIFSTIHSLKTLSLVDAGMDPNAVTTDGLLTLASGFKNNNKLQKQQLSSSSSSSTITTCFFLENITLGYFISLNDTVMKALGEIKSLRSLCIASCQGVTDCGLEQFIDQATSTTINGNNHFLSLSIYQCKNVTKKGLQYASDKLGRANVKFWQYM